MIKAIHHVGLAVQNLAASTAFYTKAAQLRQVATPQNSFLPPLPNVAQDNLLAGLNAQLRLMQLKSSSPAPIKPRPVSSAGITHFCLQAPDVLALHRDFAAAGASFHSNPIDLGTGFLYCYSRDLEANVVELEGVPKLWYDPTPWFAHVSFSSSNLNRLADFYSAALRNAAIRSGAIGPHARIDQVAGLNNVELRAAWIYSPNIQIEIMQYQHPATVAATNALSPCQEPGYTYVCFEVDETASALKHLLDIGATQPSQILKLNHATDGSNAAFCADPDGNIICLLALGETAAQFATAALPAPDIVARMNTLRAEPAATAPP